MPAKKTAVTRKFLNRLANRIYNPTDRSFLRLCNGTLQNGPDPTNKRRPMHCGLGELYFAMTGRQPDDMGIDEEDVVELAVKLSPIAGLRQKAEREEVANYKKAVSVIEKLTLSDELKTSLVDEVEYAKDQLNVHLDEDDRDDMEHHFREALYSIPTVNDDNCSNDTCKVTDYRTRSRRVAAKLREAAKLLP